MLLVCFVVVFLLFESDLLFVEKNQNFRLSVEKVGGKMYSNEFFEWLIYECLMNNFCCLWLNLSQLELISIITRS